MPISLTSNKPLVSFGGKRKIDFDVLKGGGWDKNL